TIHHRALAHPDSQTASPRLRLRSLPSYVAIRPCEEVSVQPCSLPAACIFPTPLYILLWAHAPDSILTCRVIQFSGSVSVSLFPPPLGGGGQCSPVFRLGDGLINRTHKVEGLLGQMVILPRQDCLAAPHGLGQ